MTVYDLGSGHCPSQHMLTHLCIYIFEEPEKFRKVIVSYSYALFIAT
jgi:hypothetical protein